MKLTNAHCLCYAFCGTGVWFFADLPQIAKFSNAESARAVVPASDKLSRHCLSLASTSLSD